MTWRWYALMEFSLEIDYWKTSRSCNQGNRSGERSSPSFELINKIFSVKRVNIWNRIAYMNNSILGFQILVLVAFFCLHKNQQKSRTLELPGILTKAWNGAMSQKKVVSSFLVFTLHDPKKPPASKPRVSQLPTLGLEGRSNEDALRRETRCETGSMAARSMIHHDTGCVSPWRNWLKFLRFVDQLSRRWWWVEI